MNQYHREVEQVQDLFVIAQVCRRMWMEFVNRAILSGAVKKPSFSNNFEHLRSLHRPQAWKHIHPQQDVAALQAEVEAGFTSRQSVIDKRYNESAEEVDRQREEDQKREEKLGLKQEFDQDFNNQNGDQKDAKSDKDSGQTVSKKPQK